MCFYVMLYTFSTRLSSVIHLQTCLPKTNVVSPVQGNWESEKPTVSLDLSSVAKFVIQIGMT